MKECLQDFRYNKKTKKIKTLEDAYKLALELHEDCQNGTFKKSNYKRKSRIVTISDNISDFIQNNIFPRIKELHLTLDDKIWIEEWLEPFMCEVGVFTVSEVHLRDFISTFGFRGEEKERAERLFNLIKQEIRF